MDTETKNTLVFEEVDAAELNSWQDIALGVGIGIGVGVLLT